MEESDVFSCCNATNQDLDGDILEDYVNFLAELDSKHSADSSIGREAETIAIDSYAHVPRYQMRGDGSTSVEHTSYQRSWEVDGVKSDEVFAGTVLWLASRGELAVRRSELMSQRLGHEVQWYNNDQLKNVPPRAVLFNHPILVLARLAGARSHRIRFAVLRSFNNTSIQNAVGSYEHGFYIPLEPSDEHPIFASTKPHDIRIAPNYAPLKLKYDVRQPRAQSCVFLRYEYEMDWKYAQRFWTATPSHRKGRNPYVIEDEGLTRAQTLISKFTKNTRPAQYKSTWRESWNGQGKWVLRYMLLRLWHFSGGSAYERMRSSVITLATIMRDHAVMVYRPAECVLLWVMMWIWRFLVLALLLNATFLMGWVIQVLAVLVIWVLNVAIYVITMPYPASRQCLAYF